MESESKLKAVLTCEAAKVARIDLRKDNYSGRGFGEVKFEFCVAVIARPRDLNGCPVLGYVPVRREESGSPDLDISAEEIGIWHPEDTIVAKLVVKR